jgi:hypothetical protein
MCTWMLTFIRNWPYLIWMYVMAEKPQKSQTINWKIDLHECVNYILYGILNEELWKWN